MAREKEARCGASNPLTRFGRLLALGAVVAGVTASAAMAIPVVDPQDGGTAVTAAPVSRPPDVQDAATAQNAPTAAGLKADGQRLQGIAQVYAAAEGRPRRRRALRGDAFERRGPVAGTGGVRHSAAGRERHRAGSALRIHRDGQVGRLRLERLGDRDRHRAAAWRSSSEPPSLMGRQLRHAVQTA